MKDKFESITIISVEDMDKKRQDIFSTNKEFKDNEKNALLQSLAMLDDIIKASAKENLKFPNEFIKLKIKLNGKEQELNTPLGVGAFSKDLNHLINLSNTNLNKEVADKNTNKQVFELLERFGEGGKFKQPEKQENFKNIFNDLRSINLHDEELNGVYQATLDFFEMFKDGNAKVIDNSKQAISLKEAQATQKLKENIVEIIKENKVANVKESQKDISKPIHR
ncbi:MULTISPECIES: hypothetical protein [unclassified Campylobacter]|uniref:hypothetical protein n=1 Tax=unclassified Campylobacter TaxID=2593542 RepID=UPI001DEA9348|nr:hypothetical protein [Campylobacter sp. RM12651]MBZ7978509.1 hypothetical protein [Campylobacter sp. RM12654]MBZ7990585.1 hypothetical protein [Campylobacter sp. RM9331]MBZ8004776.1 hypothetical protein [Campylobacter sp. RM9332]ULO04415.1 hypothetical protein AVBRAN_1986 [Campylobacter sp. RM12651]